MKKKLLQEYIKLLLSEDIFPEDVLSNRNPVDAIEAAYASPESFAGTKDKFEAMQIAAKNVGLIFGGRGTSRAVFMLDDRRVLKLAINEKGIEQNKLEAFSGQDPAVEKILAQVFKYSDEFIWLISEKVTPMTSEKEFEEKTGIEWNELRATLGAKEKKELESTAKPAAKKKFEKSPAPGGDCLKGQAFIDYMKAFTDRYPGMLIGDILKTESWGTTASGCAVLLDYGITQKKHEELYKKK